VLTESDIWKIGRLEILYRQSRLFSWQLRSKPPQLPLPVIPDLWRGDAKIGAAILQGMTPFAADSETFARFDWVRDLRDYGVGAQILTDLGIRKMILLSDTRPNVVSLEGYDLEITDWQRIHQEQT
jgi:hypothetical protein